MTERSHALPPSAWASRSLTHAKYLLTKRASDRRGVVDGESGCDVSTNTPRPLRKEPLALGVPSSNVV